MNYQDTKLAAQLATALSRRAPAILFYGPDDAAKGTVAVKRTDTRKQTSVPRGNLVREVLTILRPST
jgi:histidyl-tRNA synthetase